ncbi:MAG: NfeD family protein [Methanospirillum sp.]|uniref:NfeD family protein n=1 Tax=Methanospirillum sp. TaxID=45200 RepID=UPI002370374B|nr:NfeD family protein [Methanospirillum sp.]MDD1728584.1 NfeD family protein [Methanospirillum sp.]
MAVEGLSYGWLVVLAGTFLIGLEVFSPGFFLLVPGTVLIIIGILLLLGIDIFSTNLGILAGVGIAIAAALVTVFAYSRMTPPGQKPYTTSMDSLIGKEGLLITEADAASLDGKVSIEGQIWSAKAKEGKIPEGARIRVISSKGVHIVVEEVE